MPRAGIGLGGRAICVGLAAAGPSDRVDDVRGECQRRGVDGAHRSSTCGTAMAVGRRVVRRRSCCVDGDSRRWSLASGSDVALD